MLSSIDASGFIKESRDIFAGHEKKGENEERMVTGWNEWNDEGGKKLK